MTCLCLFFSNTDRNQALQLGCGQRQGRRASQWHAYMGVLYVIFPIKAGGRVLGLGPFQASATEQSLRCGCCGCGCGRGRGLVVCAAYYTCELSSY